METTYPSVPPPTAPPSGDPTKVFGRRVGAAVIDGAIVLVPSFIVISSQFEYLELRSADQAEDYCEAFMDDEAGFCVALDDRAYFNDSAADASTFFGAGLTILMFVILQGLTGWTIGKRLLKLRLVREDGGKPGLGKALVRWLLWIIDGLPFLGIVGFITGLTTVGHRRVGDMVAKTYVVDAAAAGRPIVLPGSVPPPGSPMAPSAYGAPAAPAPAAPSSWPAAPAPSSPAPTAPPPAAAHPQPTAKAGPQWDEQRKTYIQWDPELRLWMQWDDAAKTWNPIPNQ